MLSSRAKTIAGLLAESSDIAMRFRRDPGTTLKADRTPVTRADRAVERFLTERLEEPGAGIRILGEEMHGTRSEAYLRAALREKMWIIDPIDGTAMFAHGIPVWGIILGYAEDGVLLDGGVVIPEQGEMLLSDGAKTYYGRSDRPFREWDLEQDLKPLAPPAKQNFDDGSLILISQRAAHGAVFQCCNTLTAVCSTAYFTMLMSTGRIGAAIHDAKLWDYGGCLPPLKNLGLISRPLEGEGDLLDLRIAPENYDLSFASGAPSFRSRGSFVFASSEETAERVRGMVRYPSETRHV